MATAVVVVMAAVVLLDVESSSRRLQVQIRIQMQIEMHVQIQTQTWIHSGSSIPKYICRHVYINTFRFLDSQSRIRFKVLQDNPHHVPSRDSLKHSS